MVLLNKVSIYLSTWVKINILEKHVQLHNQPVEKFELNTWVNPRLNKPAFEQPTEPALNTFFQKYFLGQKNFYFVKS